MRRLAGWSLAGGVLAGGLAGCPRPPLQAERPTCTLISINDTYQIEGAPDGSGGMARVRALRARAEAEVGQPVWLLHAGDFLYPSLMSRSLYGAQMVRALNLLDGDAAGFDPRMLVVFGNHEFDKPKLEDAPKLDAQIDASGFRWLDAGVQFRERPDGTMMVDGPNLVRQVVEPCGPLKIGFVGATIPLPDMGYAVGYVASFPDPVEALRLQTAAARGAGADYVIAITHRFLADDIAALQTLGDSAPDLLIGGHEHDRKQETINGRAILKADADARSAWRIDLYVTPGASGTGGPGAIRMVPRLEDLGAGAPADPIVQAAVDAEWTSFGAAFCADPARALPPGCLADAVGRAGVTLEAEELKIRRFETNFGDWVTDIARSAWPQAQIAFLNSGSLRLNYDLPPGPISRKAIETMFAYPTPLRLLRLSGAVLDQALSRTVEAWTGNGHWLQISGFAFRHDTQAGTHGPPWLLSDLRTPVAPLTEILAVVPDYLVNGNDGYTMLNPGMIVDAGKDSAGADRFELKAMVLAALAAAPEGIAPVREGRICSAGAPEAEGMPCLAP